MKKIRVYELAKEADMDSKALTAKLQDMGYAVKSHSSSLEEDTANEIRLKLGIGKTTTEETRIQGKGRTTIIRRRKSIQVEEEPAQAPELEPALAEAEQELSAVEEATLAGEAQAAAPLEPAQKTLEEEGAPEEISAKTPEIEGEAPVVPAGELEISAAPPVEGSETAETVEGLPEEGAVRPELKSRKGLARVIKRAAITLPAEVERRQPAARQPAVKKPEKVKGKAPVEAVKEEAGTADKTAAVKAKKGKRFVKFQTDTADRDRAKKGVGLGKRKTQVDIDVEDLDELGAKIPAGLRFGRMLRGGGKKGKHAVSSPDISETKAIKKRIKVLEFITVADLAHRMGVKASEVIAKLMSLGFMATINQALDVDSASLVATDFGYEIEQGVTEEQSILNLEESESGGEMVSRPPVVTVMGHVDHGKTSILDAIRQTDVAAGEAGGITQHIGAHYVRAPQGDLVFLDTPGHAAFTEMRSRGAQVTDVVVLVVAADDGVMDQTKEAINHARAAKVPILVAVNKIDKPNADPMRVKRELADLNLVPEEWGGDTIYCETSAKTKVGIDNLVENILVQAEILELKADPKRKAKGHVIEAQLHKGRGPVATVLIEQGTLRVGDPFVAGNYSGRVRSLTNDHGENMTEAGPAIPVEIQGLSGVPQAGDEFVVVTDEKMAKSVSAERQLKSREAELSSTTKISLENLFDKLKEGEVKELRVALRADVQGTLEAFVKAIGQLSTDEVKVRVLHEGTGTITESDVLLAAASDALIIGFNVRPSLKVQEMARKEKVDLRTYDVIYHALDDIRNAMVGMLEPAYEENVIGTAEVRETFSVPKLGTIAGCYVTSGKIERNAKVRIVRDGVVIFTGVISSLRRFKDDVKEVQTGYECGMGVLNYNDIKLGDILEAFVMKEVAREL
jgi:translation initiation factor IF-2